MHTHNRFFMPSFSVIALQYASLFFIVGVGVDSDDENELGVLEFIHCLVETLDKVRLQFLAHQPVRFSVSGARRGHGHTLRNHFSCCRL